MPGLDPETLRIEYLSPCDVGLCMRMCAFDLECDFFAHIVRAVVPQTMRILCSASRSLGKALTRFLFHSVAVRIEAMGATIVTCVGVIACLQGQLGGNFVGLALIWAVHFTTSLSFITISWAEVDSRIVSAERVQVRHNTTHANTLTKSLVNRTVPVHAAIEKMQRDVFYGMVALHLHVCDTVSGYLSVRLVDMAPIPAGRGHVRCACIHGQQPSPLGGELWQLTNLTITYGNLRWLLYEPHKVKPDILCSMILVTILSMTRLTMQMRSGDSGRRRANQ